MLSFNQIKFNLKSLTLDLQSYSGKSLFAFLSNLQFKSVVQNLKADGHR